MNIKSIVVAIASLAALSSAQAATHSIFFGTLSSDFDTADLVMVEPGAFTYNFFYTVTSSYYGSGTVADFASVSANPAVPQKYNITGMSLSLFVDSGAIGVVDGADSLLAPFGSGDFISAQTPAPVAAGSYYFQLTGTAAGTSGGQFAYAASTVSAVPEPETMAMMLAGLGMLGWMSRRRPSR